MSAYVVDLDHIAYLVQAGTARALGMAHEHLSWVWNVDRKDGTYERETLLLGDSAQELRVGQMLWDENVKSVRARYPEDRDGELPGPIECDYRYPERVPLFRVFDRVQVIKACDCYDYQSCEHEEWPDSEAKAYIDSLRLHACGSLPGYDDARWGAPRIESAPGHRTGRNNEMSTEHTPAPWHYTCRGEIGEFAVYVLRGPKNLPVRRTPTGLVIAHLGLDTAGENVAGGEREANARLIARAPNLLKACEFVLREAEDRPFHESRENWWVSENVLRAAVAAVPAKGGAE